MVMSSLDYLVYGSIGLLAASGVAAPLLGKKGSAVVASVATAFTALSMLTVLLTVSNPVQLVLGGIVDGFTLLVLLGASLTAFAVIVGGYEVYSQWNWGESVPAIVSLALLGAVAIGLSDNVLLLYSGWILGAAATYILIALAKDWISAEAAVKYATLGGIASVTLVIGLGYLFASNGTLALTPVQTSNMVAVLAATALVVAAAGYKMGVVPYHGWVPDVYGNVRPLLVSIAAPLAKAIAVLLLLRVLLAVPSTNTVLALLALLAALTMTFGNVAATVAKRPQQVLAYSSIAQAGYLLAGFTALKLGGIAAQLALIGLALHVLGYMFSKAAAFLALDSAAAASWDQLKGLWRRDPLAAAGLSMGLASLLGMPPALGFWGKLYIVLALAKGALPLALVMAVNFAIGAYYYAKMMNTAFMEGEGKGEATVRSVASLLLGLLTFILGTIPALGTFATMVFGLKPF